MGLNHWTPLHYAAHADDQEIIHLLLDKGADKMAMTIDGRTPRDLCIKWAMKKLMYSRPEYEVEYERWLYPEKYEEEQRLKEEADKAKWEEIKVSLVFVFAFVISVFGARLRLERGRSLFFFS